jgi:LSD1 subclass zinc finger protein
MNLETIACNQCGAPLSVPEGAKFITCNHCHANLAVRRNESVRYTEMVEKIAEHTANLAEQVAHLRYQNELERIDREWQQERDSFMITDKDGARHEPSEGAASIVFVLVIAFGIFWTIVAGAMFPPFALFGILFVGAAIYQMVSMRKKAQEYQQAQQAYKLRRNRLSAADFLPSDSPDRDDQHDGGATNPKQASER